VPPVPGFYQRLVEAYSSLTLGMKIGLVAAIALLTTAAGMLVIVQLPAEHFVSKPPPDSWWRRHRIVRWLALGVKNALGLVVLPLGIFMMLPLVPGPGLVFVVLGLSLLDFPGKRKLERRLLGRPSIMRFLNDMRANFGKPPFVIGPD
jgi:hypothetical protein